MSGVVAGGWLDGALAGWLALWLVAGALAGNAAAVIWKSMILYIAEALPIYTQPAPE